MTYVISHTSALEVMRSPHFPKHLKQQGMSLNLPREAPSAAEVEHWLNSSPELRALTQPPVLLATGESSRKKCRGFEVRTANLELPPDSLVRIGPDAAVVSPELLLLQMARNATPLELIMLISELCGLYAIAPENPGGLIQRNVPLTDLTKISDFLKSARSIPGCRALNRAIKAAFELCASPQEAKLAARIAWKRSQGGYAIPIIGMNESLEVKKISRELNEAHIRRPDIILRLPTAELYGIGLEYNGFDHLKDSRPQEDSLRTNELLAYNMKPYTIWNDQYQSVSYMDGLLDGVIRPELGLSRNRPTAQRARLELAQREAFLAELNVIDGLSWGVSDSQPTVLWAKDAVAEARERPVNLYGNFYG